MAESPASLVGKSVGSPHQLSWAKPGSLGSPSGRSVKGTDLINDREMSCRDQLRLRTHGGVLRVVCSVGATWTAWVRRRQAGYSTCKPYTQERRT